MSTYGFTEHAYDMLKERGIKKSWVDQTIRNPDMLQNSDDGTVHYIKAIREYGSRHLRVIVNQHAQPKRIITVFFDRRLGRRP